MTRRRSATLSSGQGPVLASSRRPRLHLAPRRIPSSARLSPASDIRANRAAEKPADAEIRQLRWRVWDQLPISKTCFLAPE